MDDELISAPRAARKGLIAALRFRPLSALVIIEGGRNRATPRRNSLPRTVGHASIQEKILSPPHGWDRATGQLRSRDSSTCCLPNAVTGAVFVQNVHIFSIREYHAFVRFLGRTDSRREERTNQIGNFRLG